MMSDAANAVLAARARALAAPADGVDTAGADLLLACVVDGRRYAVDVRHVEHVVGRVALSTLPWSAPAVAGVASTRGDVLVVADLGRLFDPAGGDRDGPVIVLAVGARRLGVMVDAVLDVFSKAGAALVAPPEGAAGDGRFVLGITEDALVLDAEALLASPLLAHTGRHP